MTTIHPFFDPRTGTLTYLVYDELTRDAVVIDPVLDYESASSRIWTESSDVVCDFIKAHKLKLHLIIETHAHADHLSGAQHIKGAFPDARLVISRDISRVQKIFKAVFNLPTDFPIDGSQFDALITPGTQFAAGSITISALATPGHTPACMSYLIGDALFTGDVLFMPDLGTGRCDFPGGSAHDLYHSIHEVLYALPGRTRIFVGHDYPKDREVAWETTVSDQKRENVALPDARSEQDFVAWREARDQTLNAPRLLFQSVQVNIDAGHLPAPADNETSYLKIPINAFRPRHDLDAEDLSLERAQG